MQKLSSVSIMIANIATASCYIQFIHLPERNTLPSPLFISQFRIPLAYVWRAQCVLYLHECVPQSRLTTVYPYVWTMQARLCSNSESVNENIPRQTSPTCCGSEHHVKITLKATAAPAVAMVATVMQFSHLEECEQSHILHRLPWYNHGAVCAGWDPA